jgi:pimeloyl-ACP methyl ester carboxylesterase
LDEVGRPRHFPPGFDARGRHSVPLLDYNEQFIVEFVNELDKKIGLKDKIQAVIGGSLGGNMTFRLGRRHDLPWLKNVVTWSPASIWDGLADGGDILKQLGVATAWNRAGGDIRALVERDHHRRDFFRDAFGGRIDILLFNVVPAQPDQWWRPSWACFSNAREAAKIEREEIYNRNFRLWHWRLGMEQLVFSQQYAPNRQTPRYMDNHVRMLLACGTKDDFNYTNICSSTHRTAQQMTKTPGTFLLIKDTGHSIHNERPLLFAKEILKFLK